MLAAQHLAHLEHLGDATKFAAQIHALIPKCALLENFSTAEVRLLAHFMEVYSSGAGIEIIREGEVGYLLLMILEVKSEAQKQDRWTTQQLTATADAGNHLSVL